ncbi:MAG: glycosyltransferase family 4 protein [Lachnospiraceae bacterium]|nr:glycosyltransferase family 4 protein [Lachnospiraceae bacterium]
MSVASKYIATPPGITILEQLEDRGMTYEELAKGLNISEKDVNKLISGSSDNKGGENRILEKKPYKFINNGEIKGFIIKTSDYHKSYKRVLVALQFQYRLWALRKKLPKPDVIVSEFAGLFGNVFLRWKKEYGTMIIYDILDLWPEAFVNMGYLKKNSIITKFLYYLEHKSYKEADGIIFSFQGGKDYIVDKGWSNEVGGDVDTSDIGYLNNGVNLEELDKQKEKYILEDKDLDSDKFKVVYLGSISEFNGLDVLVKAAKIIQNRKKNNISILIYGYGNQEERLKSLSKKYGLNNLIFKGALDKRYAMSVLSRANINIFTFINTNLLKYGVSPNKLFMYFASGKPVLSMIRPSYDLVEKYNVGISVNNNPSIVADAILKMSEIDINEYNEYCRNARLLAEEYDYDKLINVLINKIERG